MIGHPAIRKCENMNYRFSDKVLALKPNAIREILKSASDPDVISLSAGNPAPDAFPVEAIREISEKLLRENPIGVLQYGVSEGYQPLRDTLKAYLKEKHGIGGDNDELIIVSGAQQVMDLSAKSFLNEGDVLICEAPSFVGALNTFRSYNTELVGVTVQPDGMDMEELEKTLDENPRAKMIYTIPTFQNPTGRTLSLERRKKVAELAGRYGVIIAEDDPYRDLRYRGTDLPPIKSFDTEGWVVFMGSFSKVISPGLRVGYLAGDAGILRKCTVGKQSSDVHTANLNQAIVDQFLRRNLLPDHIARISAGYAAQCDRMLEHLASFPEGVRYTKPEGGLFIWAELPENISALCLLQKAIEKKVAFVPGTHFYTNGGHENTLRLNFSGSTPAQIDQGMETLRDLITES